MNKRLAALVLAVAIGGGGAASLLANCGPFGDVSAGFCPFVLELYYLGITAGTGPGTFSPDVPITRGQAAVFVAKGIDTAILRSSRRAALGQWWTTVPRYDLGLGTTDVGIAPTLLQCDGADLWVANHGSDSVSRVRVSDGKLLETWTGAIGAFGVQMAMGKIFVTGQQSPGALYMIDPTQPAGIVTTVANNLGDGSVGIAFDRANIWTANSATGSSGGSLSIITPSGSLPWAVSTISQGFTAPTGILFDGANMWVSDLFEGTLKKWEGGGTIFQTIPLGTPSASLSFMVFDGANLWVPGAAGVLVVSASTGTVLATLSGNGIDNPAAASFDGNRILITNYSGNSVSLFKAADLTPLGNFPIPAPPNFSYPLGTCNDGHDFWFTLQGVGKVARF